MTMKRKKLKESIDDEIERIFNYNDEIEVVSKETCLNQLKKAAILSMEEDDESK